MGKEHQIFEIRAIIEAIESGATVNKVYIQKEASSKLTNSFYFNTKMNCIKWYSWRKKLY
jgi:hypothetical protein